jgi:serine/threonine protein kinase
MTTHLPMAGTEDAPARGETQTSLAVLLAPERPPGLGPFIGRFEIVRLLGRGGFGVVYEARDTELGRHVALKLMRTDGLGEDEHGSVVAMFRAEAAAAARLNHPNVVTLHDHGVDAGVAYLVLELVAGETLGLRRWPGGSRAARCRRPRRSRSSRRSVAGSSTRTPPESSTAT